MPLTLTEILADHSVDQSEIDAIFTQFDADGSGKLERQELIGLFAMLSKKLPGVQPDLLMQVLDFYDVEHDGALDKDELRELLKVQLDL